MQHIGLKNPLMLLLPRRSIAELWGHNVFRSRQNRSYPTAGTPSYSLIY